MTMAEAQHTPERQPPGVGTWREHWLRKAGSGEVLGHWWERVDGDPLVWEGDDA